MAAHRPLEPWILVRVQAPLLFSFALPLPLLRGFFSKHKQALRRPAERRSVLFMEWNTIKPLGHKTQIAFSVFVPS
jgi:hypothetical protein